MRDSILQKIILPAAIIIAGFAAVVFLSGFIERRRPALPAGFADSDLDLNGSQLVGFAFGMEGLLADWYYVRSLQYIGEKLVNSQDQNIDLDDLRGLNPRLFYPLINNATDLDPHFLAAYSFGAIVLPTIDKEKAVKFAAKGIADNPNEWRLYQHLGYIYWRLGQYDKAAEIYERGSSIPGSSAFMRLMAAAMKTEGASRSTARSVYREMLVESDEQTVKDVAERRLLELDSLDERETIDKTLVQFKDRNGRCANGFGEIITLLMKADLPDGRDFRVDAANRLADPTGEPYILDKENCRVRSQNRKQ